MLGLWLHFKGGLLKDHFFILIVVKKSRLVAVAIVAAAVIVATVVAAAVAVVKVELNIKLIEEATAITMELEPIKAVIMVSEVITIL